jgi:hypothetical protein
VFEVGLFAPISATCVGAPVSMRAARTSPAGCFVQFRVAGIAPFMRSGI